MIELTMHLHKTLTSTQRYAIAVMEKLCIVMPFRNDKPYSKQYTRSCIKLLG
jgi:hypothetical protein